MKPYKFGGGGKVLIVCAHPGCTKSEKEAAKEGETYDQAAERLFAKASKWALKGSDWHCPRHK